jgi:2-dehydro-3-deoxy-D-arabinonate dehydratase
LPAERLSNEEGELRFGRAGRRGQEELFVLLDGERASAGPPPMPASMIDALTLTAANLRERLEAGSRGARTEVDLSQHPLLPPISGRQEVWASGVTYERSLKARVEESIERSVYDRVYEAERPELFLKAPAYRVVGPGEPVGIRSDSSWNVPEPELALVVNAHSEIVGYTLGNDMSSRSIEGENPLYLPQAKIYDGSCAIGPCILPAWEVPDPKALSLEIEVRREGASIFTEEVGVSRMKRTFADLVDHLFRSLSFPNGVIVLTGTGIVPDQGFSLQEDDLVRIACDRIGILENVVKTV